MSLAHQFRRLWIAVALVMSLVAIASGRAYGQGEFDLVVSIPDTTTYPGDQGFRIPIYMSNYHDTVAAFEMSVFLSRPDLISFRSQLDTVGSLVSGWEYLATQFWGSEGTNLRIVGMANTVFPPPITPGIGYPQTGETPLLWVYVDVELIDDTVTDTTVSMHFITQPVDLFIFSDQNGQVIGLVTDTVCDTTWWRCQQWLPDSSECISWMQVTGPPADSIGVTCSPIPVLDTAKVSVRDGLFSVGRCGDVANVDGRVNLSDVTRLIDYVYMGGEPPVSLWAANVDGDLEGRVNLTDITMVIDFVYLDGPCLSCQ
jgi:hypothetical protein